MAFQSGSSGIHIRLIQHLINELTQDDFMNLKLLCKGKDFGGYGAGELEKITTLSELFSRLQQKTIFKEGSYGKLKELLTQCGHPALAEKVSEAEREIFRAGIKVEGLPPPGATYSAAMNYPEYQHRPPLPETMFQYNTTTGPGTPMGHGFSQPDGRSAGVQQYSDAMPFTPYNSNGSGQLQSNPTQPWTMNQGYPGTHPNTGGYPQTFNTNPDPSQYQRPGFYPKGRGFILFINNYFNTPQRVDGESYDRREGAEIDDVSIGKLLKDVLSQHQRKIVKEVPKNVFWAILADVRAEINRSNYSFLMFILSSHGAQIMGQEWIILPDAEKVTVEEIQEYFSGTNAPALINKPKVFIFQACRGLKAGVGVPDLADCSGQPPTVSQLKRKATRPDNADVLLAHSTSEGTRSWRNSRDGTWYIHHLCKAITFNSKRKQKEHFLDLLLSVHDEIAPKETNSEERAKQMPCYTTTFTKKFEL